MQPIRVVGRKQKLMDFLRSEEGNADRSKVLATGAVLGGSVLAQMLLAAPASADGRNWTFACNDMVEWQKCLDNGCQVIITSCTTINVATCI